MFHVEGEKMQKGMTLMSVMVATALSGIVGLMVMRLMSNQAEAMLTVKLREEREILIKHYRQVVIGGWDKTMASTGATDPTTATTVLTRRGRSFPITLGENLYTHDANGWWEVEAKILPPVDSGQIQHSDAYSGTTGLHRERSYTVILSVSFDPKEHPVANMKLADRKELIYMGYRWQKTKQSGCGSDSATALTRRDTTTGTQKPLYHPDSQGAVVSYSFSTNYIKCSQVPLVANAGECPKVSAILGFESQGTGTTDNPFYRRVHSTNEYVTGRLACSYPIAATTTGSAWKAALGTNRYYMLRNKVWDDKDTANLSTRSSSACHNIDKSYVDFVTGITATGTGGGELICEPTLIAPKIFSHYYDGSTRRNSVPTNIAGSALGSWTTYEWNLKDYKQPGPLQTCRPYRSYDGSPNPASYNDHVGYGGYTDDHSGGLKQFTSTSSGTGARTDPFRARPYSRGVPGDRGSHGECECGNP